MGMGINRREMLRRLGVGAGAAAVAGTGLSLGASIIGAAENGTPGNAKGGLVAAANWRVSGDYLETCSCDFLCPCITNAAAKPTQGGCIAAMAFRVNQGNFDTVKLDGLSFVVVVSTPGPMGEGKWTVGLIVDERADAQQREAITGIASGKAGGPMAAWGPLITNFAGVEFQPIHIENKGPMKWTLAVPGLVEQGAQGVPSRSKPGEPLYLDNTGGRANPRLALARSTGTHISVFGIKLDDQSGANNGHFAPFNWKAA